MASAPNRSLRVSYSDTPDTALFLCVTGSGIDRSGFARVTHGVRRGKSKLHAITTRSFVTAAKRRPLVGSSAGHTACPEQFTATHASRLPVDASFAAFPMTSRAAAKLCVPQQEN